MKSLVFVLLVGLVRGQQDVCFSPFSQFLKCVVKEVENRLEGVIDELGSEHKNKVQGCFASAGCDAVNLNRDPVQELPEPWRRRAEAVLDLLESTDSKVKNCMITYFKDIASKKLEECTNEAGISPTFYMPDFPVPQNLDFKQLKQVIYFRMSQRKGLEKCDCKGDDQREAAARCIVNAGKSYDQTTCRARENCEQTNIRDGTCKSRYERVHSAACVCVDREIRQKTFFIQGNLLKFANDLSDRYRQCHDENGVRFPQEKMDRMKNAINEALREFLNMPQDVKDVIKSVKDVVMDLGHSLLRGLFCSSCEDSSVSSERVDMEARLNKASCPAQGSGNGGGDLISQLTDKIRQIFGG